MKKILYTQRVMPKSDYGERWDCADQNIARLIIFCGYMPIPVNNNPKAIIKICTDIKPDGLILTGGNSLVKYGGDAPERDETEKQLLAYFLSQNMPIYGFCRGMQIIQDYFGIELHEVQNHVACRHNINGRLGSFEVNSYHNFGAFESCNEMEILAQSQDGVVEAVRLKGNPVICTMWHPEREKPFCKHDIERIKKLFNKGDVRI